MPSKEVLSDGELAALMDEFSGDNEAQQDTAYKGDCRPFDFTMREQTLLVQMPALKKLNEKQSLALSQEIKGLYEISAQVEAAEVQLLKLDQALANIAAPSAINLAAIDPLNGHSYVVLPGELLSFLVDRYFGGAPANTGSQSTRTNLTPTEIRINEMLTDKFLHTLVDAWQEKIQLSPRVVSMETRPTFLQASSPAEQALLFSFEVKVGDWSSAIDWIVPYASLEPLRLKLGNQVADAKPQGKNRDWEQHFHRELQSVELEVSGSLASGRASIADVLNLKPGSIVPLRMPTDVTLCVESQAFSFGEHGVLNGHKSVKIKEIISNERDSN